MKEENKSRLESIFEKENKAEKQKNNKFIELRTKQNEFLYNFQQACSHIISPIMLEFKSLLDNNGYSCFITSTNEDITENGFKSHSNIRFEISRNTTDKFYAHDKYPHIMFIANKQDLNIIIHVNTIFPNGGGHAFMKSQSYTIDQITNEVIEQEITESIENILKKRH